MAIEQGHPSIATGGLALDDQAVQTFGQRVRGQVLRPGGDGFDSVRGVWNGMIDRSPAVIVRCAGVADVITAINFARDHDLVLAVRGGGHSAAGSSVCDRGLMIDLSLTTGIRVDPARRTARAEPGVTWAEFDRETQAFGLATTGGFMSTTGIAGLTLGGGLGYLMRRFGLACDNLLSVDIVTADGQLRRASTTEHQDLFWGLRGGGGNFGIVTSFAYRLHPVGPTVLGGLLIHPISAAREVLQFYREFAPTAPEELTIYLGFATSPEGDPVVAAIVCYSGPMEQGEAVIGPLRKFGTPVADLVGPMPYTALQDLSREMFPPGRLNYWKSSFVYDLSDQAIDTMIAQFTGVPSPFS